MTNFATAVLVAIALAAPASAFAASKPADPRHPLPSSYAPGPHDGPHVYGSPIETGGASQAQAPRHKHAVAKKPAKAPQPAAHDHKASSHRSAVGPRPSPG